MRKFYALMVILTVSCAVFWSCSDDDSSTSPTNNEPVISELISTAVQVAPGGTSDLYCNATDEDGDALSYNWTCTGGTVSGIMAEQKTWTAPAEIGTYTITVNVSDGHASVNESVNIEVTATPTNPPVIISLTVTDYSIEPSTTTNLLCNATDADDDVLSYAWSCSGGSVFGTTSNAVWTAPATNGSYTVTCTVSDPTVKTSVQKSVTITVEPNVAPVISSLAANPASVEAGGTSNLICTASDVNGDNLSYQWNKTGGTLVDDGESAVWTAPNTAGTYTITCTVSDGLLEAARSVSITVTAPPATDRRVLSETYTDPSYPEDNSTAVYAYDSYNRIVTRTENYDVGGQSVSTLFYSDNTAKQPYRIIETYSIPVKQGVPAYQVDWTYESGKVKTMTEIEYDQYGNEEWKYIATFTYSGELMTKSEINDYNYGSLDWSNEETYTYSGSKLTEYRGESSDGSYSYFYKGTVTYSGDLVSRTVDSYSSDGLAWDEYGESLFTYLSGLIYGRKSWNYYKQSYMDSTKFEFSGSNLIKESDFYYDSYSATWPNDDKNEYSYDAYGNLIGEIYSYWNGSAWTTDGQIDYTYGSGKGNMSDIMKCMEPWYYYTGGILQMIEPEPMPVKEGDGNEIKKLISIRSLKDRIDYLKSRRLSK